MSALLDDVEMGSDDEGEAMSAAEVLQKLEEAWLNEKFSPELQENKTEIVECIMEQISVMEDNIDRAKKGEFKVSIHRMEIDRIRYVLSSYLRTRLAKVERFAAHLLDMESKGINKLSEEELNFAKEYHETRTNHYTNVALKNMPPNLQALDPKQTTVMPVLDSYVFLRVHEATEGVMVEEETADSREEIIDLEKDDQHIIRYRPIRELVQSSTVSLI